MLREAHRERQEKISALKSQLECKNLAGIMYVLCSERRRCKVEKMNLCEGQIVNIFTYMVQREYKVKTLHFFSACLVQSNFGYYELFSSLFSPIPTNISSVGIHHIITILLLTPSVRCTLSAFLWISVCSVRATIESYLSYLIFFFYKFYTLLLFKLSMFLYCQYSLPKFLCGNVFLSYSLLVK